MAAIWWPYGVAAGVVALDRATKWLIETRVAEWESYPVIPGFFQIVHARNTGIAFSMLAQSGKTSMLLIAFTVAVLALILWLTWNATRPTSKEHWTMRLALGLVLGGAIGNLYDRAVLGSVTDFLDVYWGAWHFPAFNVADSGISVGAALLILDMWLHHRRPAVGS
jgi:signal peptidase II